jgi:uncharacterized protein (TIGR02147 family)
VADATPDLLGYLDYRAYLRELYELRKRDGTFSYRTFSRRVGLGSPNYLKLVIDGDRNLSPAMATRFARAFGLSEDRRRYFEQLVRFNQARTVEQRDRAYAKLRRLLGSQRSGTLQAALEAYHSLWYVPAIRELVTSEQFRDDPRWIARRMLPNITAAEARSALRLLERLGMIVRDARGRLRQATPTITTGPEVRSRQIAEFHRTMLDHAKSSLERVPARERDISALTLCLGEHGLVLVKKAIQRFRRELLEVAELEQQPRQVVQVNFQLFPLTQLGDDAP